MRVRRQSGRDVGDDAGLERPADEQAIRGPAVCGHELLYVKLGAVHSVQISDETFVAADPVRVGAAVGDPASWRRWWPDLRLRVIEDRADKGIRWAVTGPLTGTMEIWLEPSLDGVLLHYFLHAEPSGVAAWQLARMNLSENDPPPPGRGQENGLRGEDDAGALPTSWGFSGA